MKEAKPRQNSHLYEFGSFVLVTGEQVLLRDGEPVQLTPKAFETLLALVENSGHVMTKDELMERVWPDTIVEESNLAQNISTLRKALGDEGQQFIQTLPKRGYRFAMPITISSREILIAEPEQDEYQKLLPSESGAITKPEKNRLLPYQLTLALVFVIAPLAMAYFIYFRQPLKPAPKLDKPRTLAVLPFRNLKQESETEFLSFSLADAIITRLGYINALNVRPSSYVDKYRNQDIDPKKVAIDLNINTLLTGTYIKEGNDLRITAQLVDVITNEILWKDALDLKYENLISVQDRVTQQVIRGLQLNLTSAESDRLKRDEPKKPLAYEYYLRGVDLYATNEFKLAIQMLEQSVRLEPDYALAWAHLGRAQTAIAAFDFGGEENYRKAQTGYEKALALNPDLIEARIFMANMFTDTGRAEEAVPLLRKVLETSSNHPEAHWELGYAYRFGGMLKESISEGEIARRLDPEVKLNSSAFNSYLYDGQYEKFLTSLPLKNSPAFIVFYRGFGNYHLKKWEQANADFELAYKIEPKSLYVQIGQALKFGIAKQNIQGLELLRATEKQITSRKVTDAEAVYKFAQAFAELGDKIASLRLLRSSIEGGFFCYPYFVTDPLLNNLRDDPEYKILLQMAQRRHEEFKRKFF